MARTLLDQQQAYTYRTHTRHRNRDNTSNNTTNSTDNTAKKRIKHIHTNTDSNIPVNQSASSGSSPNGVSVTDE